MVTLLLLPQGLELEKQAEGVIELESRIEVAEGERDAARAQMQAMTPRPDLPPGMVLPRHLGPQGTARFAAALTKHRSPALSCCTVFSSLLSSAPRHAFEDSAGTCLIFSGSCD